MYLGAVIPIALLLLLPCLVVLADRRARRAGRDGDGKRTGAFLSGTRAYADVDDPPPDIAGQRLAEAIADGLAALGYVVTTEEDHEHDLWALDLERGGVRSNLCLYPNGGAHQNADADEFKLLVNRGYGLKPGSRELVAAVHGVLVALQLGALKWHRRIGSGGQIMEQPGFDRPLDELVS